MTPPSPTTPPIAPRARWIAPRLVRLAGGHARAGANQVIPEGTFANGS